MEIFRVNRQFRDSDEVEFVLREFVSAFLNNFECMTECVLTDFEKCVWHDYLCVVQEMLNRASDDITINTTWIDEFGASQTSVINISGHLFIKRLANVVYASSDLADMWVNFLNNNLNVIGTVTNPQVEFPNGIQLRNIVYLAIAIGIVGILMGKVTNHRRFKDFINNSNFKNIVYTSDNFELNTDNLNALSDIFEKFSFLRDNTVSASNTELIPRNRLVFVVKPSLLYEGSLTKLYPCDPCNNNRDDMYLEVQDGEIVRGVDVGIYRSGIARNEIPLRDNDNISNSRLDNIVRRLAIGGNRRINLSDGVELGPLSRRAIFEIRNRTAIGDVVDATFELPTSLLDSSEVNLIDYLRRQYPGRFGNGNAANFNISSTPGSIFASNYVSKGENSGFISRDDSPSIAGMATNMSEISKGGCSCGGHSNSNSGSVSVGDLPIPDEYVTDVNINVDSGNRRRRRGMMIFLAMILRRLGN